VNPADILTTSWNLLLKPDRPFGRVQHIQVEPTNYCNQRCIMCNRSVVSSGKLNTKHLTPEEFDHILQQVGPKYVSLVGFGEPLMHPDFEDLARVARRHDVHLSVTSNLSVPGADVSQLAARGVHLVYASLDHPGEEGHKAMGRTGFSTVIKNLQELVRLRDAAGGTPRIRLQSIIMAGTYRHLSAVAERAADIGVDHLMFAPCHYIWNRETWQDIVGTMDRNALFTSMIDCARTARKRGLSCNIHELVHDFDAYWQLNCTPQKGMPPCLNFWGSCFIDVHGDIRPCGMLSWNALGNIFQENFYDIWTGDLFQSLRKKAKHNSKSLICDQCIPQNCSPRNFYDLCKRKIRGFTDIS
jgi:MoaA/NifB/PqqE/SkfB family radical SAM enzyme